MTEEMKKRIDQVYERWTRGVCPGAQVLIRVKGEIVYDRCFGYADIENQRPITDETVFHVASVSKQFTVMGAMLLREEGKLDIDADVRCYIPEYIGFEEPITVRDLMNNDTGIRDLFEIADQISKYLLRRSYPPSDREAEGTELPAAHTPSVQ